MAVVGIVAEYNPLHMGHAYHISRSREETGAEAVVCVLSSQFVQRGEPAIVNKQARTRMALMNGVDLVIELPSAFSCASAEYFAACAVKLLDSIGVVDAINFGSEHGSLTALNKAADILVSETPEFKAALKLSLDKGLSFPASRQAALKVCLNGDDYKVVSSPNNILGIEYLKALKKMNSTIKPVTIRRLGQEYNEGVLDRTFSSATAIRNHIRSIFPENGSIGSGSNEGLTLDFPPELFEMLLSNLPESSLKVLETELRAGRGPVFPEDFEKILFHRLRIASDSELMALPYMEKGLHNRLRQAAIKESSLRDLVAYCTTSRYPSSRINRILTSLLLGMTDSFLEDLKNNGYAQYIRVLGFNARGKSLLASARKKASLPILIKPSSYKKIDNPLARKLFEHEIRSADVYCLAYKKPHLRKGGSELTTPPVIM